MARPNSVKISWKPPVNKGANEPITYFIYATTDLSSDIALWRKNAKLIATTPLTSINIELGNFNLSKYRFFVISGNDRKKKIHNRKYDEGRLQEFLRLYSSPVLPLNPAKDRQED